MLDHKIKLLRDRSYLERSFIESGIQVVPTSSKAPEEQLPYIDLSEGPALTRIARCLLPGAQGRLTLEELNERFHAHTAPLLRAHHSLAHAYDSLMRPCRYELDEYSRQMMPASAPRGFLLQPHLTEAELDMQVGTERP